MNRLQLFSNQLMAKEAPTDNNALLWTPDPIAVKETNMEKLKEKINKKYNTNLQSYDELWRWSVKHISDFWAEVFEYVNIIHK